MNQKRDTRKKAATEHMNGQKIQASAVVANGKTIVEALRRLDCQKCNILFHDK
jgi:hypothetical protein